MRNLPFDKPGRFYKGNIHMHSTNSDGLKSPAEAVQAYRERGYDFVALTDHFMERFGFPVSDTSAFRTDDFTTIFGAELHGEGMRNGELWHIVALGLPLDFPGKGPNENGPEIAARATAAGAFVVIAHPHWNGVTQADALRIEDFDAIEIHNEGHTNDSDRGNGWMLADVLATSGYRFSVTAADDAHFKTDRPDTFGGWIHVKAESLDPDALLAALKAGYYYASTGPEIHDVRFTDTEIVVSCDPVTAIFADGRGSIKLFKRGEGITEARFPIGPFANAFCRIEILRADGKKAWTSPLWLDEITLG